MFFHLTLKNGNFKIDLVMKNRLLYKLMYWIPDQVTVLKKSLSNVDYFLAWVLLVSCIVCLRGFVSFSCGLVRPVRE